MESAGEAQNSVASLLAGLTIALSLNLVWWIARAIIDTYKKKSEVMDQTVQGLNVTLTKLESRLMNVEREMNEVLKFRHDFRRLFAAVKAIAGERWGEVRKAMLEDDIPS